MRKAICSEFHYLCDAKINGKWERIKGAVLPFFIAKTLDESLDSGKMVIGATMRKEPLAPFTPIRFSVAVNRIDSMQHNRPEITPDYSKYEPIYMLVSSDSVVRKGQYFQHEIELVETTKTLERHICDTITFTNAIGHDFQKSSKEAPVVVVPSRDSEYFESTPIKLPQFLNDGERVELLPVVIATKIKDSNGRTAILNLDKSTCTVKLNDKTILQVKGITVPEFIVQNGAYHIEYDIHFYFYIQDPRNFKYFWSVTGLPAIPSKPKYSVTDVIQRILRSAVTRRAGLENQQYTLDPEIAAKYANVPAPEFYITRSTLFEALLQVGAYIHAIPRTRWNPETDTNDIITFDELGGSEEYALPQYCLQQGYIAGIGADGYCGNLDSIVENLITTTDLDQGSVTEPDYNAYKTTRTEVGNWIIQNDSVTILTDFPIYRILNLEMGYINNDTVVGQIIPFVYEEAEYATLTAYGDNFPYSKKYALVYRQGDKEIRGLSFKGENPVDPAWENPVIVDILNKLGITLQGDAVNFKNLAFRVQYIPIVTTRLKQYKPYTDFPLDNSLINNQSANTVETEFYGEHLKGTIARLGNVTEKETYYFRFPTDLPKVGQLFSGRYVVALETRYEVIGITCTLTMTKDYNKLSEYLGLNSNYRLYDVSEKQSVDRYVNYCEKCIIGDSIASDPDCAITAEGIERFAGTFNQQGEYPVSVAITQGFNDDMQAIEQPSLHACASFASGNSIAFAFAYTDNYGAGYRAEHYNGSTNLQKLVPYGDEYGEMRYLGLKIGANTKTTNWGDQVSTNSKNGWSNDLPLLGSAPADNSILFDTGNYPLDVSKDSRERLLITYQIPFIANRKSIVIGQALTKNNLLVTTVHPERAMKIMFFPFRLNGLRNVIDLSQGVVSPITPRFSVNTDRKQITFDSFRNATESTFKSWAAVDESAGTYYFGENMELAPNAYTNAITFTFTSNK